ncbi:MAG: hypothetical protein HQ517_15340 [SAR324 cluster bacterium]|nr:hypothetical protein [SAR324 cluster bacterium]
MQPFRPPKHDAETFIVNKIIRNSGFRKNTNYFIADMPAEFIDKYGHNFLAEIAFAGDFLAQKNKDADEQGKPASRWPDDEGTENGGVSGFSHIGH